MVRGVPGEPAVADGVADGVVAGVEVDGEVVGEAGAGDVAPSARVADITVVLSVRLTQAGAAASVRAALSRVIVNRSTLTPVVETKPADSVDEVTDRDR